MKYRVEITRTAAADLRETASWIRDRVSPVAARRWIDDVLRAAGTLQDQPMRCPVADESEKFPETIRYLLHGKRGGRYRILFTVRDDAVILMFIRHASRGDIEF